MLRNKGYMQLLICLIVLLCSCSSSLELSGDYSSRKSLYSLKLNKDSTFFYQYKFQYAYEYSQGAWGQIGKNKVILNSGIKNRTLSLKVQDIDTHELGQINFLSVNVNIPDADKNYYQCMIFINDTLYGKRSCDSLASIVINFPIRSIFFKLSTDTRMPARSLDTLSTEKFFPKAPTANKTKINIILNDSMFNYRVFNNEVLKVTGKGIRFYDYRGGRWKYIPKGG